MGIEIARRDRVANLREVWPKETDFSDWLITEDGLALIAEDVGIEVEEPRRECAPGDFPCDIVGHTLGDESHVIVIENQFGRTNHDHLGKLLTYASANSAMTAIWIAEHVSEDHRKVIDWLNDNTPESITFYLARIQAYRIGNSPVAPQLDVVSRPNFQAKARRGSESEADKTRSIWRQAFWQEILDYIAERKPPFRLQSAGAGMSSNIAIGRSHFVIALTLVPKRQVIGCELYIESPRKTEAFQQLQAQQNAIESELGDKLQWNELPDKKAARILLEAPIDPREDGNREIVKEWMYKRAVSFYRAFQPRVKALRLGEAELRHTPATNPSGT